jgi:hypothetical protein
MGLFRCDVHGINPIVALCEHAAAQLDRGALDETESIDMIEACAECSQALRASSSPPDESTDLPHHARCSMCFDLARVRRARAFGEADPFFVYERTLWPIDRDELDELRGLLLRSFTFPVSAMSDTQQPACWVVAGSYARPTTITVYGIVDTATQDALAALVRRFFDGRTRNQAKVVFVEAMVVDAWRSADGKSHGRSHRRELERVLRIETLA